MDKLLTHQTALSANVVLFCRFLRKKGFTIGVTETTDTLTALTMVSLYNENNFKNTLKALLTKSRYQQQKFDEFYSEFWNELSCAVDSKTKQKQSKKKRKTEAQKQKEQFDALKSWLNLKPAEEEKMIASPSDITLLTKKDFNDLSADELRLITQLLKKMAKQLAHQESRLKKQSKRRRQPDIKRTIRHNMRRGGNIERLIFSEPKERKLKLVLLCDVSKSMDLYSRFFVHLIYAFQNTYDKIETFVFSTALHRVSEILNNHDFNQAFDIISERVPQWSGGTTIGSCLHGFTQKYGHSMLDKKTIVLILSDGWDTGDQQVMRSAMKTIHKRTKKVVWLNPLAGNKNFSPDVLGMKTSLPYIDVLAPAHNLDSLKKVLKDLGKRHYRPLRGNEE